jgi:putative toxin-antitoxin system antitoxin component (TIGR02293 family)
MPSLAQALDFIGGEQILHAPAPTARDLIELVRHGLPVQAVDALLTQGHLTLAELDHLVMPRKTLYHRRKLGRLTAGQSDRLLRVVRILALAEETFVNRDKAHAWLRRPTQPLADERPLDLLDTEEGARAVESLLGRIAHGIAA